MTASIERRLEALEAKRTPEGLTIWIRSVSPGGLNRPVRCIRYNVQAWQRDAGESEDAFKNRAKLEAVLPPGHSALLMLMD